MSGQVVQIRVPQTRPVALLSLMALNVVVFVLWHLAASQGWQPFMEQNFLVSPELVMSAHPWTLLTSAFSHTTFAHIFFNMVAMWVFGQDVERVIGARGFVHLYVMGGIMASVGHVLYGWLVGVPTPALGASGAVMAIAVVSATLFPERVLLLFLVIPIRQYLAVALFIFIDVAGLVSPMPDTIAHAAHLGGAAYGWFWMGWWGRTYIRERLHVLRVKPKPPPGWTGHPPL